MMMMMMMDGKKIRAEEDNLLNRQVSRICFP